MAWMRLGALIGTVVVVGISAEVPTAGATATSSPVATASEQVTRQVQFRTTFGLQADPVFVEAQMAATTNASSAQYGVALTDSELADIQHRFQVVPEISDLFTKASEEPGFAGAYVDQKAGGTVVLMATPGGLAAAQPLLAALPPDTTGKVVVADNSYQQLEALRDKINADQTRIATSGVSFVGAGIDVINNLVNVNVLDNGPTAAAYLRSEFGTGIEVSIVSPATPASCTGRGSCWDPAKAALWITDPAGGGCTSGFVSADTVRDNIYLFTAGHCGAGTYIHNGVSIGRSSYDSYYDGSWADARVIDIADSERSNEYYKLTTTFMHITSEYAAYQDYVGQPVCIQSWYWGNNCGSITNVDQSTYYLGLHFYHQREANYGAHQGDSGDGIYTSASAEGLEAALNNDFDNFFGQIGFAETLIDTPYALRTCQTMSC